MQAVIPQLRIGDADRALAFYVDALGFSIDWRHQFEPGFPLFFQLTRDGQTIFLTQHAGDCQPGGAAYFKLPDVDGFAARCREAGVAAQPEDTPWGTREFSLIDPDGNRLRFATHPPERAAGEPLHIGIVGCSAEGAALCYRTVVELSAQRLGGHRHPEVSMHTLSLQAYVEALDAGDRQAVADLMLTSARKLAAIGADFLVCPDNTIHQAMPLVRPASPRPWLHIAEVVAQEARRRGYRRVGLTGTAWLVASDVYPQALAAHGIDCVKPDDATRRRLGALIMDELVHGVFKPETTREFQAAVQTFRDQGCDAVVLGCTEIPLILGDHNCVLPTLDSTRLLAAAAVDRALAAASTN